MHLFEFNDDDAHSLLQMLRHNNGLKCLELRGEVIPRNALLSFSMALADNKNSSLEKLTISFQTGPTSSLAQFATHILAQPRLKKFCFGPCSEEDVKMLAGCMSKNFSVEEFTVWGKGVSKKKSNLQVITKLNRLGRRYLIEQGPECRISGINLIATVRDDLDCLFYHLRENPLLCDFTTKTKKRRREELT